ncbi:PEP-CTERM sorting domain-containing protein [Pseudoduganella albidiflava]|uniref:PEP-CTERM sorting domain-containing protein n=1 Tax=Pseudoduganella albidiflava TaxID=321983 RepID=A0A411WTL9_9BURK|nr:PEP-CTERM sorting domain-containing protein [Pseudoduganella albidiflava]QBH99948.1 PEP-CTERM sorting domain-containing protein [Pseudoduganella albidiflava]GGY55093.1 hypothetical protein GCM10007387_41940 [Pseudoduganella albidiflava]
MRTFVKNILLQGALLLGVQAAAQAAPILLVSNGVLMGAEAVEVNGEQYDVLFSDTRPQASNLLFDSFSESYAASDALDRLVFQGVYDMSPALTNGCGNPLTCSIVTAFDVGRILLSGTAFTNTATRYLDVSAIYATTGNSASSSKITYANWSVHNRLPDQQQAIPEPSTLLLAGAGLAALAWRRKARRAVV